LLRNLGLNIKFKGKSKFRGYKYNYNHVIVKHNGGFIKTQFKRDLLNVDKGPFLRGSNHVKLIYLNGFYEFIRNDTVHNVSKMDYLALFCGLLPVSFNLERLNNMYLCEAGYSCSQEQLREYSVDNISGKFDEGNLQLLLTKVNFNISRLSLPSRVPFPGKSDMQEAKVKLGTHPGVISRRVFSYVKPKKGFGIVNKEHLTKYTVNMLMEI